jgi:hypothetical protein
VVKPRSAAAFAILSLQIEMQISKKLGAKEIENLMTIKIDDRRSWYIASEPTKEEQIEFQECNCFSDETRRKSTRRERVGKFS